MNEKPLNQPELAEGKLSKEEYMALAVELSERKEGFPFSGVESETYARIKIADAEYPGFTTPIDEQILRFRAEGIKVAFGPHPETASVFILPMGSDDINSDSISPWQLEISEGMDDSLKKLILADRANKPSSSR